ncbi:serine hydroxymethyltransferase [Desulfovibrio gilichinskyi]|uniref:Glycine hydroxymethyltransferase n=1 Tax=Desulfovibrio gilichinskyi TaxID=1519643 RepID=A0A1X7D5M3_9BACT|nr:beta-eliminating lyase-related protein [Desulfovibrio gilichinskyi]SMF09350.1 glycine hydroxymethyltransferase [Desulfovibrio gilichinskyi]
MVKTYTQRCKGSSEDSMSRLSKVIDLQWGILNNYIHLIASASYPFSSVLKSLSEPSFVLPAEGMPGARFLPGAGMMDIVETEGESLVLDLFGNPKGYRATLQPHSGTQANQIAYNAILKPNDKVLCLKPCDGGHISHTVLISRRHKTVNYGLTPEGQVDYTQLRDLAKEIHPKLIIVGGSAQPREIDFEKCAAIANEYNAFLHADISHTATFIAAGLHKSVFPYCDFVTFNTVKNLRGPNSGIIIYRESLKSQVHSSIFPVTQGGANETNMLGKYTALLEWKCRDIREHAKKIISVSKILGDSLKRNNIKLTTGGTDCHILLVELEEKGSGAHFERRFEELGVLINKNLVPNDRRSPTETSGLRIGTTNLAILDYEESDINLLGSWIAQLINGGDISQRLIKQLTQKYNWQPK